MFDSIEWWEQVSDDALDIVVVNGKKAPRIYWCAADPLQLGAYQQNQGGTNDCALYSIAAAFNLLAGITRKYSGAEIATVVNQAWVNHHRWDLRMAPNSATFPWHQRNVVRYYHKEFNTPFTARTSWESRESLKRNLLERNTLQLVTLFYIVPPTIVTDGEAAAGSLPGLSGHTMVLVAYDPTHMDRNNMARQWGFVNSWQAGGRIYWLSDSDLGLHGVVRITK